MYNGAFSNIKVLKPLYKNEPLKGSKDAYHLYPIIFKVEDLTADRDTILNALQAENIGVGVHFRAVHLHPFYQKTFDYKKGTLPVSEYSSDRLISLPLYPKMSDSDVCDVIKAVKKVIYFFKRR